MPQTIGIDLAADGKRTSVCEIDWKGGGRARVGFPQPPKHDWTDPQLIELIVQANSTPATKIGIDCPLGWPVAFVRMVADQSGATPFFAPPSTITVPSNAKVPTTLTHRVTDHVTRMDAGIWPLSVSTNLLGVVALRLTTIFAGLPPALQPVDRSGAGVIAEVYPAAALRRWWPGGVVGAPLLRYKKPEAVSVREQILEVLLNGLGAGVELSDEVRERCLQSHDDLDAFICALVARAVELGETKDIPESELGSAVAEGWIHLPDENSLGMLAH